MRILLIRLDFVTPESAAILGGIESQASRYAASPPYLHDKSSMPAGSRRSQTTPQQIFDAGWKPALPGYATTNFRCRLEAGAPRLASLVIEDHGAENSNDDIWQPGSHNRIDSTGLSKCARTRLQHVIEEYDCGTINQA